MGRGTITFRPGESKEHRILKVLGAFTGGLNRRDIEDLASVSFSNNSIPLQRLLSTGLISHELRGPYEITDLGIEALGILDSGESFSAPIGGSWAEHFENKTW